MGSVSGAGALYKRCTGGRASAPGTRVRCAMAGAVARGCVGGLDAIEQRRRGAAFEEHTGEQRANEHGSEHGELDVEQALGAQQISSISSVTSRTAAIDACDGVGVADETSAGGRPRRSRGVPSRATTPRQSLPGIRRGPVRSTLCPWPQIYFHRASTVLDTHCVSHNIAHTPHPQPKKICATQDHVAPSRRVSACPSSPSAARRPKASAGRTIALEQRKSVPDGSGTLHMVIVNAPPKTHR